MIEEQRRNYGKFQLIKWQVYRKLENERIEIEAKENIKKQMVKFWVSKLMANNIVVQVYKNLEWKIEDKYH